MLNRSVTQDEQMTNPTLELIEKLKIIPVIQIDQVHLADGLSETLNNAGLSVAEITLRTDCALRAIDRIAHREEILVGAGTVMNIIQAKRALDAGAAFIVSPGLDEQVVSYCMDANIPVFPGVATATELQKAMNLGLNIVKFFPAEAIGGAKVLQALSGPFGNMKFIPTGGINIDNLPQYVQMECVFAVGGSWFVKPEMYADGDFGAVEEGIKTAMEIIQG